MTNSDLGVIFTAVASTCLVSSALQATASQTGQENWRSLMGKPVDIAPSAYLYRSDRKPQDNAPESWFALMHYAKLPLNQPVDVKNPAIKQALSGLLWEEIRPIQQLELTWSSNAKHRPTPEDLLITTLDNQGTASSWWNNLTATPQVIKPTVSKDGVTYVYSLRKNTCGIVVSLVGSKIASDYDVPNIRALVADTWKKMDLEIEWGFDKTTESKDYSGRIETYDGRLNDLQPLKGQSGTRVVDPTSWHSNDKTTTRRGVKLSLLYMGTSKWRKEMPFTSKRDDVARTIVTVWTKSGNFSFLAADLEHGPILAPEYGFFVRRTSKPNAETTNTPTDHRVPQSLFTEKMNGVAGSTDLKAWGTDATPWFGGNPTDKPLSVSGIEFPTRSLAMHPGPDENVAVGWKSPLKGQVSIKASLAHAQKGSDGIEWWVVHENKTRRQDLNHNVTDGTGSHNSDVESVTVNKGDMISLVVGRKGTHYCDTTLINFTITELDGNKKSWDLVTDVVGSVLESNPHPGSKGDRDLWEFYTEPSSEINQDSPSEPPFELASNATGAKEFVEELKTRNLKTVREQIRNHPEQSWEGAVTAMRGPNPPAFPKPPAGEEPVMQVQVPSEEMTAQWNLGAWHLLRHCAKNPKNGKLWFNDFPYGILGAETYMVLAALDLMGSHQAVEDGLDQWVSLPMDPNSSAPGHHEWALKDRPNGLFSEGHGCLTHAVGPDGWGGQMDGVHAFGPGSIGWALTEHFWLTGDKAWLKASAPRITANAEWMLRQRQVNKNDVPGGERLWCKGLQPALQVTPDSGGLWMQFYEAEAYYWYSVSRLADSLSVIDPDGGAKLKAEAEAYRKDLKAAVERSIALSPVVAVRDGTYRSVIPFACYVRGLSTTAWGWQRDGSGSHVGPMYWETVQSAAALVSPAGLLPANDVRVQGYLDVLEDRLLLENANSDKKDWFDRGWQYQGGLERTSNMHLAGDDIPTFLRSFLNCYAIDILEKDGYIFNEHAVHGPPDKIFEEAAFLERFRNMLVMEQGSNLWLTRATPRAWLEQGKKISIKKAPTHFGNVDYEIVSDVDNGKISASITMPNRGGVKEVWLRLRHPQSAKIVGVTVNGKAWKDFDPKLEVVKLHGLTGSINVEVRY